MKPVNLNALRVLEKGKFGKKEHIYFTDGELTSDDEQRYAVYAGYEYANGILWLDIETSYPLKNLGDAAKLLRLLADELEKTAE